MTKWVIHEVRKGQSLNSISADHGIPYRVIYSRNKKGVYAKHPWLDPGDELVIGTEQQARPCGSKKCRYE